MRRKSALAVQQVVRGLAPDPRMTVFEVDAYWDGSELRVTGACSDPALVEEVHRRLGTIDTGIAIRDEVVRLPADEDAHAIVTAATAPLLAGPLINEPAISQAALGQAVLILRERGRWLQVRTGDGYLGWTHRGYLQRVTEAEARSWTLGAGGVAHLCLEAAVRDEHGRVLLRLPWGARVIVTEGTARLPDGRTGELTGETIPEAELTLRFPRDGASIVATAERWMGTPYLWGGITTWGADCSGLVQVVFRTHGVDLPRDSDQQALTGDPVELTDDFAAMRPGDLLFFAEADDRISHVAISLGGSAIIHSALGNGGVQRNDLRGDSGYERDLRGLLVGARRLV